jgi:hypothetical protein
MFLSGLEYIYIYKNREKVSHKNKNFLHKILHCSNSAFLVYSLVHINNPPRPNLLNYLFTMFSFYCLYQENCFNYSVIKNQERELPPTGPPVEEEFKNTNYG